MAIPLAAAGAQSAGSLGAGALAYLGTQSTNRANAKMAQKQMDFQERMSNTSFQRSIADARAAGVNPMFALGHGASTPPGARSESENALASGANSALDAARSFGELQNLAAQNSKLKADTALSVAQAASVAATAKITENAIPGSAIKRDIDQGPLGVAIKYIDAVGNSLGSIGTGLGAIGGSAYGLHRAYKAFSGHGSKEMVVPLKVSDTAKARKDFYDDLVKKRQKFGHLYKRNMYRRR